MLIISVTKLSVMSKPIAHIYKQGQYIYFLSSFPVSLLVF